MIDRVVGGAVDEIVGLGVDDGVVDPKLKLERVLEVMGEEVNINPLKFGKKHNDLWREVLKRVSEGRMSKYLFLSGAIRSGKTALIPWIVMTILLEVGRPTKNALAGKTFTAVVENQLGYLREVCLLLGFSYRFKRNEGKVEVGQHSFEIVGLVDKSSADPIQGRTYDVVVIDESMLCDPKAVEVLVDRASTDVSVIVTSNNPIAPNTWFQKNYIDNDRLDSMKCHFTLFDNPNLGEKVVRDYVDRYAGNEVGYSRKILGVPMIQEGLVYGRWAEWDGVGVVVGWWVGVDYGVNAWAAVLAAVLDDGRCVIWDEVYWQLDEEVVEGGLTDVEVLEVCWGRFQKWWGVSDQDKLGVRVVDGVRFMGGSVGWAAVDWYLPHDAGSLRAVLSEWGCAVVLWKINALEGIEVVNRCFVGGDVVLRGGVGVCEGLVEDLGCVVWDEKMALKGEDVVLKGVVGSAGLSVGHAVDALRMGVVGWMRFGGGAGVGVLLGF